VAATAPAAATTATAHWAAEARLLGGAVRREHGELPGHLRVAAVRARRVGVVHPDELLEVALALHAHELVDRHRSRSVGTQPDAAQAGAGVTLGSPRVGDKDFYGPMRGAVREAAKNLKPLAGRGLPLVVVIANPKGYLVPLSMENLVPAMVGNPGWSGRFNPETARVERFEFEFGRDGRLRNDHA